MRAGTELEGEQDGISYLPALLNKEQPEHDYLVRDFAGYGGQVAGFIRR